MPTESRYIALSEDETLSAIHSYARTNHRFLPHGEVQGFILKASEAGVELVVVVDAVYGATRTSLEVRATPTDIVNLLIRCCLENNIPIPRRGKKSAALVDGALALVVQYDSDLRE